MNKLIRNTEIKEVVFIHLMSIGIVLFVISGSLLIVFVSPAMPDDLIVSSQIILMIIVLLVVGLLLLLTGLWFVYRINRKYHGDGAVERGS